jgi:hypothetical protein
MFVYLIILSIFTKCLYIFFFALTWGPISWIIIGEVFPLKVRGLGAGITSLANWCSNLLVALVFPVLFEKLNTYLFLAFASVAILSIFFVKHKVFETRGKSLYCAIRCSFQSKTILQGNRLEAADESPQREQIPKSSF